jgi:hypothetical protein
VQLSALKEQEQLVAVEAMRREAEETALRGAARDEQARAQIADFNQAAEEQQRRIDAATLQVATAERRLAELDANASVLEAQSRLGANREEELKVEIENLHTAGEEQRGRIAEAEAEVQRGIAEAAQQEAERARAEAELRRIEEAAHNQAEAEQQLLAELEAVRRNLAKESHGHAEREMQIRSEIETQGRIADEQRRRTEELEAQYGAAEAARLSAEEANRTRVNEERRRIKVARKRTENEERRGSELESMRLEVESELREIAARAELQDAELEAARKAAREQDQQLEEAERLRRAEKETLQAAEDARVHAEEERRQIEEAIRQHTEQAAQELARSSELETSWIKAEEESSKRANEEEAMRAQLASLSAEAEQQAQRLAEVRTQLQSRADELETTRAQIEDEAGRLASHKDQIHGELESLREAAAEQRRQLDEAEILRSVAEAELEVMRKQVADEARLRAENEGQLQQEISQLRQAADAERKRIEEAEIARRNEHLQLETLQAKAQEELHLLAEQEEQLRGEMAKLGQAAEDQRQRIEAAEASRQAEEIRLEAEATAFVQREDSRRRQDADSPASGSDTAFAIVPHGSDERGMAVWLDLNETITRQPVFTSKKVAKPAITTSRHVDVVSIEKGIAPINETIGVPSVLVKQLNSEDLAERSAALTDIARLGAVDSFQLITKSFDDSAPQVRNAAARALNDLEGDRAASFTRALREGSPERRRRIGVALAESGLANDAIINLTAESRDKVYDAFSLLFLMAKTGVHQPLLKAVEEDPNLDVRRTAITVLAMTGQSELVPAFRRLSVRGSLPADVRSALAEAVHQMSMQRSELVGTLA